MEANAGASGVESIQLFLVHDSRLHFGLGNSTSADIEVYWPRGLHETFKQILPTAHYDQGRGRSSTNAVGPRRKPPRRIQRETPDFTAKGPQIRFFDLFHKNNEIVLDYCAAWV